MMADEVWMVVFTGFFFRLHSSLDAGLNNAEKMLNCGPRPIPAHAIST